MTISRIERLTRELAEARISGEAHAEALQGVLREAELALKRIMALLDEGRIVDARNAIATTSGALHRLTRTTHH